MEMEMEIEIEIEIEIEELFEETQRTVLCDRMNLQIWRSILHR